ncbi:MAG: DNA-3-methyladenine glycosylase 2 family protein [Actinomycetota bacterium]
MTSTIAPARLRQLRRADAAGAPTRAVVMHGTNPTLQSSRRAFARAVHTPTGPGTMLIEWTGGGDATATAWGPGRDWLLEVAPRWLGYHDDPTGFDPSIDARVQRAAKLHGDVRLSASGVIWQEILAVILGQRVTTREAARSFRRIVDAWGEPAPGPLELQLPPTPTAMAERSYVDLHRMNVERRRADAILLAARRANRLEEAATMSVPDALHRLSALPGLGVWTATATVGACHGDPDTIVLRDYGLPTMVNYFFTGDPTRLPADEGGDDAMIAHLEPWRGHRQRVVQLIKRAGPKPPRRAPRAFNPDIRRL